MSDAAHNGHDDVAFFEADVGFTRVLSITEAGVQAPDSDGALPPGRYLVQAVDLTAGGHCWVHFGKFATGSSISMSTGAGRQRIPLSGQTILAFETHVRKGHSDRIGAITTAGATCTLWVTLVSTSIPG